MVGPTDVGPRGRRALDPLSWVSTRANDRHLPNFVRASSEWRSGRGLAVEGWMGFAPFSPVWFGFPELLAVLVGLGALGFLLREVANG